MTGTAVDVFLNTSDYVSGSRVMTLTPADDSSLASHGTNDNGQLTVPALLRRLMRHADVSTAIGYYVDLDADEVAGDLWAKFGGARDGNTTAAVQTRP